MSGALCAEECALGSAGTVALALAGTDEVEVLRFEIGLDEVALEDLAERLDELEAAADGAAVLEAHAEHLQGVSVGRG